MKNVDRYIILFAFISLPFIFTHAQKMSNEKQYYKDSIELARYKRLLIEEKYDSIGKTLSDIDNAQKVASISEYSQDMEDLRQKYDLRSLEIENSIRKNNDSKIIFSCVIISLIIAFISLVMLYLQNKKLKRYREKWKLMQINAEFALRNKSTMLSNMSHEIRTPLNALIGFSDIISDNDALDESTIQECNDIIKLNSSLLQNLINDVINMSRLSISNLRINICECDIIEICRKTTNTIQQIKQTQAEVLFESSIDHLFIKTDPTRIQQVLINLLVNATKFCKEGKIVLRVYRKDNDMAYFSVSDTGIGIAADNQHLVFDRFEKVDEKSHGTGLGLSICKLIITELKGKIWVDPSYTQGARFIFTLPIY